jgi:hypothetical protein
VFNAMFKGIDPKAFVYEAVGAKKRRTFVFRCHNNPGWIWTISNVAQ